MPRSILGRAFDLFFLVQGRIPNDSWGGGESEHVREARGKSGHAHKLSRYGSVVGARCHLGIGGIVLTRLRSNPAIRLCLGRRRR